MFQKLDSNTETLESCLIVIPTERTSAAALLTHPFFTQPVAYTDQFNGNKLLMNNFFSNILKTFLGLKICSPGTAQRVQEECFAELREVSTTIFCFLSNYYYFRNSDNQIVAVERPVGDHLTVLGCLRLSGGTNLTAWRGLMLYWTNFCNLPFWLLTFCDRNPKFSRGTEHLGALCGLRRIDWEPCSLPDTPEWS